LFFWQWGQRLVIVDIGLGSNKYYLVNSNMTSNAAIARPG